MVGSDGVESQRGKVTSYPLIPVVPSVDRNKEVIGTFRIYRGCIALVRS